MNASEPRSIVISGGKIGSSLRPPSPMRTGGGAAPPPAVLGVASASVAGGGGAGGGSGGAAAAAMSAAPVTGSPQARRLPEVHSAAGAHGASMREAAEPPVSPDAWKSSTRQLWDFLNVLRCRIWWLESD